MMMLPAVIEKYLKVKRLSGYSDMSKAKMI